MGILSVSVWSQKREKKIKAERERKMVKQTEQLTEKSLTKREQRKNMKGKEEK